MSTSSIPSSLSGLTTREAITDAIYRAVTAYDRQDETLLRSAMTPDITFTLGSFGSSHGVDEIISNNFTHVSQMDTTHSLSAVRIDVADARAKHAKATLNAVAMHCPKGEGLKPDHKSYQVGSLYDVDLVVDDKDGLWKVKTWVLTPVWGAGDQSIMMP